MYINYAIEKWNNEDAGWLYAYRNNDDIVKVKKGFDFAHNQHLTNILKDCDKWEEMPFVDYMEYCLCGDNTLVQAIIEDNTQTYLHSYWN